MLSELTDSSRESWPCLCIWVGNLKGYRNKRTVPELPILEMQPGPQHPHREESFTEPSEPCSHPWRRQEFPKFFPFRVGGLQLEHWQTTTTYLFLALFCVFPWESARFAWRFAQSKTAQCQMEIQEALPKMYCSLCTGCWLGRGGPGHNACASWEAHSDNGLCVKRGTD